jgi:hypothetical protein
LVLIITNQEVSIKLEGLVMMRKIKTLGLAVGATLALSAALASAAQAETGALTAPVYPAIVTGQQGPGVTFDIGAGPARTVECATSDLDTTLAGPTDPVTFKPLYAGCISNPGALPTTITTNGCDYSIGVSRPGTTGTPQTTGLMQNRLNCPAGQQLEIHVYENAAKHAENISTCTYDIGPQGPVPGGIYHNNPGAAPADVVATVNATFNALNTLGPVFLCGGMPFQNIPVKVTGNYTLRGFQEMIGGGEGAPIPIDVG